MESSTGQISSLACNTPQHNINISVPRQGDHNELLAKVAKRAERAQLLVIVTKIRTCRYTASLYANTLLFLASTSTVLLSTLELEGSLRPFCLVCDYFEVWTW